MAGRSSVPQMFPPGNKLNRDPLARNLKRCSSSWYLHNCHAVARALSLQRQKKKFLSSPCRNIVCAIIHFLVFHALDTPSLPPPPPALLSQPPLPPPSYFIRAHHRSLTAGYRCFHHSRKGPRLPLPRSYLAPFPLFPAYPSRIRVPSPRLIISTLIGSEEFHIG